MPTTTTPEVMRAAKTIAGMSETYTIEDVLSCDTACEEAVAECRDKLRRNRNVRTSSQSIRLGAAANVMREYFGE